MSKFFLLLVFHFWSFVVPLSLASRDLLTAFIMTILRWRWTKNWCWYKSLSRIFTQGLFPKGQPKWKVTIQNQNRNTNTTYINYACISQKNYTVYKCNYAPSCDDRGKNRIYDSRARDKYRTVSIFMDNSIWVTVTTQQIKFVVLNPIFNYSFGIAVSDMEHNGRISTFVLLFLHWFLCS